MVEFDSDEKRDIRRQAEKRIGEGVPAVRADIYNSTIHKAGSASELQSLAGNLTGAAVVWITDNITLDTTVEFTGADDLTVFLNGYTITASGNLTGHVIRCYKSGQRAQVLGPGTIDGKLNAGTCVSFGFPGGPFNAYGELEGVKCKEWAEWGVKAWLHERTTEPAKADKAQFIVRDNVIQTTASGTNECIFGSTSRQATVENNTFKAPKAAQLSSRQVTWKGNVGTYSKNGPALRGRHVTLENNEIAGEGGATIPVRIDAYSDSEYSNQYADGYLVKAVGNTFESDARLEIRPYDDTMVIRHAVVRDHQQHASPVTVTPKTSQGTVEQLTIDGLQIDTTTGPGYPVELDEIRVQKGVIQNVVHQNTGTNPRVAQHNVTNGSRFLNLTFRDIRPEPDHVGSTNDGGNGFSSDGQARYAGFTYSTATFWEAISGTVNVSQDTYETS